MRIAWNKGITKKEAPQLANSGVKTGNTPWNKGKKTGLVPKSAFKKGLKPWNKGLLGYLSGLRRTPIGFRHSIETREKMSEVHSGENAWNWKGGITEENHRLRNSLQCKIWRESVFERDDFTCLNCGERGGKLNADHIKPWSLFPELRFAIDNGRTLCEKCHDEIGWSLFRENNPKGRKQK